MIQNVTKLLLVAALATQMADAQRLQPSDIGYFTGGRYRALSATEKLNDLWQQCQADQSVQDPNWELDNLFIQNMSLSFGTQDDELPVGRPKINHAQGVVGLVSWIDRGNHDYTGLFDGDSDTGLIRMSESNFILPETGGLTPSLAIKFVRDGIRSVNHLANVNFEGTNSWNFFANDFRSRVDLFQDQCAIDTIERKFLDVTNTPQSVGLAEFSRFNTDGSEVGNYNFPFDMWFTPNRALRNLWPDNQQRRNGQVVPFYEQLKEIPDGSLLFRVWARDVPEDLRLFPQGSRVQNIANIRLNSDLITSAFGDNRLFFQHERMTNDFAAQPSWRNFVDTKNRNNRWGNESAAGWPQDDRTAEAWVRGSMSEYNCPFAWLLDERIRPIF